MKLLFLSSLLSLAILLPLKSFGAETGTSFGGLVTLATPCTCPPYGMMISYAPFFFGTSIPTAGILYLPPAPVIYSWFNVGVPSTWNLGSAVPGGACNMLVPTPAAGAPTCVPIPTIGTIEYMGTSLPGGIFGF